MRLGLRTNRVIVWWGIATFLFVGLVTTLAPLHLLFKTTALDLKQWSLVIVVALLGTGWIEGVKWGRIWWGRR